MCYVVKGKTFYHFPLFASSALDTSASWYPAWVVFPTDAILQHELGVLQLNSILTLSALEKASGPTG